MAGRFFLGGGIGSGKSAAGIVFESLGAIVLSGDDAGREVLGVGTPETAAVLQRWPEVALPEGVIDRRALGALVFADAAQLAELEAITAPGIKSRLSAEVDRHPDSVVLVEMPVLRDLVGRGWPWIVVDAPDPVRFERAVARGLMDEAAVRNVMARQPPRGEWLAAADWVIDNSGDRAALVEQCHRVWQAIRS